MAKGTFFNEAEDEIIRRLWHNHTAREIAARLPAMRPVSSVVNRARQLGLTRSGYHNNTKIDGPPILGERAVPRPLRPWPADAPLFEDDPRA